MPGIEHAQLESGTAGTVDAINLTLSQIAKLPVFFFFNCISFCTFTLLVFVYLIRRFVLFCKQKVYCVSVP